MLSSEQLKNVYFKQVQASPNKCFYHLTIFPVNFLAIFQFCDQIVKYVHI